MRHAVRRRLRRPWPLSGFISHDRTWTQVNFCYMLATAAAPALLGQLLQARRDLARRLVEIEEAREHERLLHSQALLARERAQLAREMHDVVSQQVSLISVQAGALQVAARDPTFKEGVGTIRSLSVDTLDELRHMVTLLHASSGGTTELTPQPTLADLRKHAPGATATVRLWHATDTATYGLTVTNTPPAGPSLPLPAEWSSPARVA